MRAVIIAFSMYSRLPMPAFPWEERDRKRAMWFFPLVGAAVGAAFFLTYWLAGRLAGAGLLRISVFRAALLTAIPVWVTGGIHMDGFLDTCDALAAWGDREKRLEILKDPHIGAFAVIRGILYFLLYFGACTVLTVRGAAVTAAGFVISRAVSGLLAASVPGARERGMLADFIRDVDKRRLFFIMTGYLLFGIGLCLAFSAYFPAGYEMGRLAGAAGLKTEWLAGRPGISGWQNVLAALLAVFASAVYGRRVMTDQFGGITGDLAGYVLQVCELLLVLSQALVSCL